MANKYYAVKNGNKIGIFNTWNECEASVKGYPNSKFKSFKTLKEAEEYLGISNDVVEKSPFENTNILSSDSFIIENKERPKIENGVAYVDGSYDRKKKVASYGAIICHNDTIYAFNGAIPPGKYKNSWQINGEIRGAGFIIQKAIDFGYKTLDLYYDYEGIEKWYDGKWSQPKKVNEDGSMNVGYAYVEFAKEAKAKIEVKFHKVKSHTGEYYNELVDQLAKKALNL